MKTKNFIYFLQTLSFLLFFFISEIYVLAQSDDVKQLWSDCKEAIENEQILDIKKNLLTVYSSMKRPLCAFYIGRYYELTHQLDSALYYYEACIKTSRKSQKRAIQQQIDILMRLNRYEQAYDILINQIKNHGYSAVFLQQLEKICKGYFLVRTKELSQEDIQSAQVKREYAAQNIIEQQMIIGQLRDSLGHSVRILRRSYKDDHQIWEIYYTSKTKTFPVRFTTTLENSERSLEVLHQKARLYFNNETKPLIGRLGALYCLFPLSEKDMIDLLANEEPMIRLCTCLDYKVTTGKKVKKKCIQDKETWIIEILKELKAFQG